MNRFQDILAMAKKYHFWVLIAAIMAVGVAVWFLSTAGLAKDFRNRSTELSGLKQSMVSISGEPEHPNRAVIEQVESQQKQLSRTVNQAWEILYGEQAEKNPLPEEILGEDFTKAWESGNLQVFHLERYRDFISKHLPKLREMVRAYDPADLVTAAAGTPGRPAGGPGDTAAGTAPAAPPGIVLWAKADSDRIAAEHFQWGDSAPTVLQVRLAQEDLWVYKALLRIIADTNAGVTNHFNAAVKELVTLEIGPRAVAAWKQSEESVFKQAAGPAGGGEPGAGPVAPPTGPEDAVPGAGVEPRLVNRYVDDRGNPLPADAKPPYEEFKMMPIYMRLVMDQRKISNLLVECANSSMPVEARRVRLNPDKSKAVNLEELAASPAGAAATGLMQPPGFGGPIFAPMAPLITPQSQQSLGTNPFDVVVDIQGVIYIYNAPPEKSSAAAEPPADAGAVAPVVAPADIPTP